MEINRTTRHEQVSAMLSSLLLLLGVITTGMFAGWVSATAVWDRPTAQVHMEDVGGGDLGDSPTGGEKELVQPAAEEMKEVAAPERVAPVLESITSLVSIETVASDAEESVDLWTRQKVGSNGPGDLVGTPAWGRWEIKFSLTDMNIYAQQRDFFRVELGVAGGGSDVIDYCSSFSAARPKRRVGMPKDEKRLFFLYKSGSLREADRTLAAKAGIEVSDRVVLQFYQSDMYRQLLILENERMGKRRISEVLKTTFGLRGTPGMWEFYVLGQKYRAPLLDKS
jgi:hypothetical protein